MLPIEGRPVLTAAAMRAAEATVAPDAPALARLMERAGEAVATAVRRLAAGAEALVLVGPGNNGGDGWVAATHLAAAGHAVRIASLAAPATDLARAAAARWQGPVEPLADAAPAPVLVDALFGIGLSRPLDPETLHHLSRLHAAARLRIAIDVPSGVSGDTGDAADGLPVADVTLALGALKSAHLLQPAARLCGHVRLLDIGLDAASPDRTIAPPRLSDPGPLAHKYSRGLVVVVGGAMAGAGALAASAAAHAGAGYVALFDARSPGPPHAIVRRRWSREAMADFLDGKRAAATAIVVGPGLGQGDDAAEKLDAALSADAALVIDGDALRRLDDAAFARIAARTQPTVLTPHAGEFAAVFGAPSANKIDAARDAARRSGATIVFKGADTVVAHPDGTTRTMPHAAPWLSTAGSGDVLAGAVAALVTSDTPDPVGAAVWLHVEAARRLGPAFLADDLARALAEVRP